MVHTTPLSARGARGSLTMRASPKSAIFTHPCAGRDLSGTRQRVPQAISAIRPRHCTSARARVCVFDSGMDAGVVPGRLPIPGDKEQGPK